MKARLEAPHTAGLLCALASCWFFVCFLYVALPSLWYPFQLEWIEGQSVDTILRAYLGEPVYAAPTLSYVPLLYTPLFYYVSALAAHAVGMDFIAGRLVSFVAILMLLALLYRWMRNEGARKVEALLAPGLFSATYLLSGRWFELARVDSLALCLLLAGLYLLRFGSGRNAALMCGLCLAAAFFTKQLTFGVAAPMLAASVYLRAGFGWRASAMALAALVLGCAFWEWQSDGWFSFYAFTVSAGHSMDEAKFTAFWQQDVFAQQGCVLAASLILLPPLYRQNRSGALYYGLLVFSALAATYAARLHRYGYINNLMPMHAVLALVAGIATLQKALELRLAAYALCLAQMGLLAYDPRPLLPSPEAVEVGNRFLKEVAAQAKGGKIFTPDVQFISNRIGQRGYSFGMGAYDVFRATLEEEQASVKADLHRSLVEAISAKAFAVIVPGRLVHNALPGLNHHYMPVGTVEFPEGYALDSMKIRRMVLYVPKGMNPSEKNER